MSMYSCVGPGRRVPVCLHKSALGAKVLLCCPGPSLTAVATQTVRSPGVIVAALNTAYPTVRPDIWIGGDSPRCYDPRLWWEPFLKIVRAGMDAEVVGGRHLCEAPMTLFADNAKVPDNRILLYDDDRIRFVWNSNALFFALHILLWMGAKEIGLAGCDMSNGTADYCHGSPLTEEQRSGNQKLYDALCGSLRSLAGPLRDKGVTLRSCTPDSPLNAFLNYTPVAEYIAAAAVAVPSFSWSPVHSEQAYKVRWEPATHGAEGVVVGVPGDQVDLLPPWLERYARAANQRPVAVADFGMDEATRKTCAARNIRIIDCTDAPAVGWFRKPFAVLRAGFGRTLLLDVDTEVTGNLDVLFAAQASLCIAVDPVADSKRTERGLPGNVTVYDSGAVLAKHGDPAVTEWAGRCMTPPAVFRGDQEVLSQVIHDLAPELNVWNNGETAICFPDRPDNPSAIVRHWVGPLGKEYLRKLRPVTTNGLPTVEKLGEPQPGEQRRTLISFWHGIGDNIMCAPAVRAFKQQTGDFVGYAMARCNAATETMEAVSDVDRLHCLSTAWEYSKASRRRPADCVADVHREARRLADSGHYHRIFHRDMDTPTGSPSHKLLQTADLLGVTLDAAQMHTQFDYDRARAKGILDSYGVRLPKQYLFFHGNASAPIRRLPIEVAAKVAAAMGFDMPIICPDTSLDLSRCPLLCSAYMLENASAVIVTDSVMYHLAHALGKRVDLAYFVSEEIRNMVRPLFAVNERFVVGKAPLARIRDGLPIAKIGIETVTNAILHATLDAKPRPTPPKSLSTHWDRETLLTLSRAFRPRRVLELGVADGHTSKYLLDNCPWIERYVGVDVPANFTTTQRGQAPTRPGCLVNDKRFDLKLFANGTVALAGNSLGEQFDLIFIDADHSAEGVARDSEIARRHAHANSIIAWHDYNNHDYQADFAGHTKCAVTEYLDAACESGQWRPIHVRDSHLCFQIGLTD